MILAVNCGSQSIKWKLFDEKLKLVKSNKIEILNTENYQNILENELRKISGRYISLIGHRIVHSGGIFKSPLRITGQNLPELEKINHLAPLHNPYNVLGIKACQKIFSPSASSGRAEIPQFAVFDTEFFEDLPEKAFTYALPEKIVKEFGFRRYGFHGISHEYVAKKAAEIVKKPFNKLKIITCHLGGGASVSAIKNGKAIDTSMGFTPMEGLVMMTRAGDMDSGIVLEIAKKFGAEKVDDILNKESGIKGICGEGEMLKVLSRLKRDPAVAGQKNKYKLALDVFVYSIQKYIGSYFAVLGGCDILVFTGSIGSGSAKIRNMICKDLKILSKSKILSIETDEELAISNKVLSIKQK
jgi:acetate kinase